MPKDSFAHETQRWGQLTIATQDNVDILPPHVGDQGEELGGLLSQARTLNNQQDYHAANLHQTTRDLNDVMALGREVANRLRSGLRSSLGPRSEKLTEFGIRPFRSRTRPPAAPVPPPPPPPPTIE
jgi:hypothetical protein